MVGLAGEFFRSGGSLFGIGRRLLGDGIDLAEALFILEELFVDFGINLEDGLTIAEALDVIADFSPTLTETVTASEMLAAHMGIYLEDEVLVEDSLQAWRMFGFGGGGFGDVGFGGQVR